MLVLIALLFTCSLWLPIYSRQVLALYFPVIYDMKYLMKFTTDALHGGLQKLAEARLHCANSRLELSALNLTRLLAQIRCWLWSASGRSTRRAATRC